MLGNYLTTALRHLWRERGYAAINLFGLAVGLALCLLVIQLAAYQLSVGDFHENRGRIYRILGTTFWDRDRYTFAMPVQLGPALEDQLPEVEEAVRFTASRTTLLRAGTREGISERVLTADPGVLRVFGFPLLRGTPETALERPYTMVLTEPLARRLFGDRDPMGQVVRVNESYDCEVTGIVGPPPPGSLLQFSALLSLATELEENPGMTSGMVVHAFPTFVQLTPGAAPEAVAARIPGVVEAITGVPATPATPAAGVSVQVVGKVGKGDLGPLQGKGTSSTSSTARLTTTRIQRRRRPCNRPRSSPCRYKERGTSPRRRSSSRGRLPPGIRLPTSCNLSSRSTSTLNYPTTSERAATPPTWWSAPFWRW